MSFIWSQRCVMDTTKIYLHRDSSLAPAQAQRNNAPGLLHCAYIPTIGQPEPQEVDRSPRPLVFRNHVDVLVGPSISGDVELPILLCQPTSRLQVVEKCHIELRELGEAKHLARRISIVWESWCLSSTHIIKPSSSQPLSSGSNPTPAM